MFAVEDPKYGSKRDVPISNKIIEILKDSCKDKKKKKKMI